MVRDCRRLLIGEALVENGLINDEQLSYALKSQRHIHKRLGEILVELGFIDRDTLTDFLKTFQLSRQHLYPQISEVAYSEVKLPKEPDLKRWLIGIAKKGASDLHLLIDSPPVIRIYGELLKVDYPSLSDDFLRELIYGVLDYDEIERLERQRFLDKSFEIKDIARVRMNLHWQKGSISAAIRILPIIIPSFKELRIPEILKEFTSRKSGLVLVTGPANSGKSTTIASTIEYINQTRKAHIVTIEDPIEYIFYSKLSLIRQRELGSDTLSFKEALRSVVRQDPNIIFVGEMRDLDTIKAVLTLAETGHLVLSTLHTQSAIHSINRIVDVFPLEYQHEIRIRLSLVLQGIITQRLILRKDCRGRILVCEILNCTETIRNLIRHNQLSQIRDFMHMGSEFGMKTLNQALSELCKEGLLLKEDAYSASPDKNELMHLLI